MRCRKPGDSLFLRSIRSLQTAAMPGKVFFAAHDKPAAGLRPMSAWRWRRITAQTGIQKLIQE